MKILLNGARGRIGRCLADYVAAQPDCVIAAGVDRGGRPPGVPFPIYPDIKEVPQSADVLIDFSSPLCAQRALLYCAAARLPCVICTTGLGASALHTMNFCAQEIPVFNSANMSLCVNLMQELCRMAAEVLGPGYAVDVVEKHHGAKLDAPSGTALALADAMNRAGDYSVCTEAQSTVPRQEEEIVLHSLRGGNLAGEHEVQFSGQNEILRISHTAFNRDVFAVGALAAARYLVGQKPGLYNMKDLIKK